MPHYGFNFQWIIDWEPNKLPAPPDERALDCIAALGFNFVRIPMNYWFWTQAFDYFNPDEQIFEYIDRYLDACQARNLHLSLNLHRAPGYCINRNGLERHNLWLQEIAQDAFVFTWETFARRYQGISSEQISFDLVNEPPDIGQYGMTRENHANLIRRTYAAVHAIDPGRTIAIDGLAGGNLAMPELADLDMTQSGRGYQPMPVSHFEAAWWDKHVGLPQPVYPGTQWDGQTWNRETLKDFYRPWRDLQMSGVRVHIGECGCYNHTPNDVALRWFADLFGLYKAFGWGYSLWNFAGPFGIVEHGRPGAVYEDVKGYQIDRELLNILLENQIQ